MKNAMTIEQMADRLKKQEQKFRDLQDIIKRCIHKINFLIDMFGQGATDLSEEGLEGLSWILIEIRDQLEEASDGESEEEEEMDATEIPEAPGGKEAA